MAAERPFPDTTTVAVVGKESVGKSELVASLTGDRPKSGTVQGTTVRCERYVGDHHTYVDTPGIVLDADTAGTRKALDELDGLGDDACTLLVVPATDVDRDLADLLPLVADRLGAVVVTFWDRVDQRRETRRELERLAADLGVPVVPVDARELSRPATDGGRVDGGRNEETGHGTPREAAGRVRRALDQPGIFRETVSYEVGGRIQPPPTVLDRPRLGPVVAVLLLFLPAAVAVWVANTVAGRLDPLVGAVFDPAVTRAATLPEPLAMVLTTEYGLLSMGPFLFVWAGPTILVFAVVIGAYTASGLLTRLTVALHPTLGRIGLTGRDLVRVVMGFGCNVPAVVNTRSCSDCTRCTTVSAIAFGSACSYQFPATLAVFAGVGMEWLVGPYLMVLAGSTLLYVRLIAPEAARESSVIVDRRTFLQWPDSRAIAREAWSAVREFFVTALPVFAVITAVAATLDRLGVVDALGGVLGPAMAAFDLPADAALVVVLASVRKDGIALFTAESGVAAAMTPLQVLVAVYLAGVLLPCLVTALTVAREVSARWAATMVARQATAAVAFAALVAWGGRAALALVG